MAASWPASSRRRGIKPRSAALSRCWSAQIGIVLGLLQLSPIHFIDNWPFFEKRYRPIMRHFCADNVRHTPIIADNRKRQALMHRRVRLLRCRSHRYGGTRATAADVVALVQEAFADDRMHAVGNVAKVMRRIEPRHIAKARNN